MTNILTRDYKCRRGFETGWWVWTGMALRYVLKYRPIVCSCAVSAQPGIETRLDQLKLQGCTNRAGRRKDVGLHAYGGPRFHRDFPAASRKFSSL